MQWFFQQVKNEPIAFGAVIRLGILMGVSFGLAWTPEQIAATMAFVEAVIMFTTRNNVTPNSKVDTVVTVTRTGTGTGG